jgi:hypothetical protein
VVALTSRQADMKKLTTTLTCPAGVALTTHLISLESLVYLTLLTLFKAARENSEIAIEATNEGGKISIRFTLHSTADLSLISYPDAEQKLLAEQLGASWKCDKNRLCLQFPAVIG